MKTTTTIILALVCIMAICSCEDAVSERLLLSGTIGDNLKSSFELSQSGDKVAGIFAYEGGEKIEVRGVKNGESLRLEEYNNKLDKLTGIFEGKFDGNSFIGHWQDPKFRKKVPFQYSAVMPALPSLKREGPIGKISYLIVEDIGGERSQGLVAKIGQKSYTIFDVGVISDFIIIEDVRDYDGNGTEDALLGFHCGGTACPYYSYSFCSFDSKADSFIVTETFADGSKPRIEKWNGKWSVEIINSGLMEMFRAEGRYILENGDAEIVEYHEVEPLKTLKDLLPSDCSEYEEGDPMLFDLDGDGVKDKIIGKYWSRWNCIDYIRVEFSNGKPECEIQAGCVHRVGVLPSKTKNVHDLVLDLDKIYAWDGSKYIKKK